MTNILKYTCIINKYINNVVFKAIYNEEEVTYLRENLNRCMDKRKLSPPKSHIAGKQIATHRDLDQLLGKVRAELPR